MNTKTERNLERMAVCFLAVASAGVKPLKSRDIINIVNRDFEENISLGSYDDIRRKDLDLLVLADLVVNSGVIKGLAHNNPTRGYTLHPDFKS